MKIAQETIKKISERIDVYDVFSEHIVLKKRGKDYVGLCPFHEEKTPSFTVSTTKQMYYCFGCGSGGNVLKFLMEVGKSSFSDVVLDLARRYQIQIQTESPENRQEFQRQISLREQLYEILAMANSFYQHALRQPQGKVALEYLQFSRQIAESTIQQFQLGYAPNGWETIYGYLVEQKGFPVDLVEKAGLILSRKSGNGYYDRFRDRLIIPIHDVQGRVIGFGGRTLTDEQPKYLNSPETKLFDKSKTLFALDRAKTAISKLDKAVVVEGYFDAIALHAAGINNVVASLGTTLSLMQIKQLLRYTESKQIILNFDADRAGVQATSKAIGEIENLAYSGEIQLRILDIPDGKDADEFLREHSLQEYQELLAESILWVDWQIQSVFRGKKLTLADDYANVSKKIVGILSKITDNNYLSFYLQYCAELLSQKNFQETAKIYDNLFGQVAKAWESKADAPPLLIARRTEISRKNPKLKQKHIINSNESQEVSLKNFEQLLLKIYLHCPHFREQIKIKIEESRICFNFSDHRLLWQIIASIEKPNCSLLAELELFFLKFKQLEQIKHLLTLQEPISNPSVDISFAVASINLFIANKKRDIITKELKQALNPELSQKLEKRFYLETKRVQELEAERFSKLYSTNKKI